MSGEPLTVDLPGLTVHGLAWGPPDAAPVLAIHGWLDNAASFARLAPLLGDRRVVAVDLPGHGYSDHRAASAAYHFSDWVPDVIAVADRLGWRRFALVGHSMGAGVACLVAGTFPERIERLVLLEGLGPLSETAADTPARLKRHVLQRRQPESRRVMPDRGEAAERVLRATWNLAPASAQLLVERGTREVPGGVEWRWDERIRRSSPVRLTEEQVLAFLALIDCPVLAVRASHGYPFDEAYLMPRLEALRHLTVLEVEGGHHVHLDHPERVVEAIRLHLA
jgi:pimeloyl-ACP methyl ester carboxylesterase